MQNEKGHNKGGTRERERERESNLGALKRTKKLALFLGVVSFTLGLTLSSHAAPPSSPYTPGETLNPTCSPGDANCTVVAPPAGTGSAGLLTYWTASSTVSSSLSLFWDNTNIRLGIGTSQPSSTLHIIAGTTGATTLQLMGLPNQTGNLLSVGSSSGQRYFTISSLGLASSTEFRSPSSTIDTLMLASASSTGNITIGGSFQANAGQSTFSNVSSTNLDIATRFNFAAASSTGNLTIGGTFQSNAGQTTLASVSSTNLFGSGYLNFVSGRADLQAVSSTNFSASGYGLFATLLAQNAVGLGSLSTSTSLVFIQGTQVGSTTLNIQGATSQTASLFTISSSTGISLFNINSIGQVGIATSTYPASSTLLTIASSSQIFNISSGGNVMIGTSTAPNAALLTIATTSNIMTVLSNGNVGIGTTAPNATLHVISTLQLGPIGSGNGFINSAESIYLNLDSNNDSASQIFQIGKDRVADAGGTALLTVQENGNVGIGTTTVPKLLTLDGPAGGSSDIRLGDAANNGGATIEFLGAVNEKNWQIGQFSGVTLFAITPSTAGGGSTFSTPAFVINGSGNVGIGTTGPRSLLHLEGTGQVLRIGKGDNTSASILIAENADTATPSGFQIGQDGTANSFQITPVNNDVLQTVALTILRSNGNVGIGTTDPSAQKLVVAGNVRVGTGTTGCVEDADGTLLAGTCSSDERLKKNITPLPPVLDRLTQLIPVTYYWRADEFPDRHLGTSLQTGLIAQEVEQQFPELVTVDDKGFKQIVFQYLPFYLLQAVKDFYTQFMALKQQVWAMAERLASNEIVVNNQFCVGENCITRDQFKILLEKNGIIAGTSAPVATSTSETAIPSEPSTENATSTEPTVEESAPGPAPETPIESAPVEVPTE